VWQAWGHLLHAIRTGRTAFRHVHGQDVCTFREHATEEGAIFDMAMREGSLRIADYLLSNFDFAEFSHVVDVGGGDGSLLAVILASCPRIKGTLFDQPHVVRKAPGTLHEAQVKERCAIVGGSFFAEVPAGADAYILKLILHDWDDDQGLILLTNCRRAMSTKGKLLIVERLLGPPNEGAETKLSDLNMMVNAGGRERSRAEFAWLLRRAGFELDAVLRLPGSLALLVAT
jgi:O-methyltransferase domain